MAHTLRLFDDLLKDTLSVYKKNLTPILGLSAVVGAASLVSWLGDRALPGFVFAIVYGLASVLATIAILRLVDGHEKSVATLLRASLTEFKPVLWVAVLGSLIVAGGFLLLVVPGVVLAVWFIFAVQIVVFERKRGMEALRQSREYVRGHWWAVFGRYLLLMLIIIVAGSIFSVVAGMFGATAKTLLTNAFNIFVVSPIGTIFTYHLYRSLAHKHAGHPEQ